MGRLIDADELIKRFRSGKADTEEEKTMCSTVRRMIKEQPTAYDVDKVVEQLDEYITKLVGRKSGLYQTVMKIVKNGGVEEN